MSEQSLNLNPIDYERDCESESDCERSVRAR